MSTGNVVTARNRAIKALNQPSTTTALANVTDLQFPVAAAGTYRFRFEIAWGAGNTTTGIRLALNGPTLAYLAAHHFCTSGAAAVTVAPLSNYGQPAAPVTNNMSAAGNRCVIEGIINCSAAGNVVLQMASENTSICTVFQGSTVEWERLL